jgi:hypothetical protein
VSLVKCAECGKAVSDAARQCPHCGISPVKAARDHTVAKNIAWLVAVTVLMWQCMSVIDRDARQTSPPDPATAARGACMLFIKQRLHDPDSAQFQDATRVDHDGQTWTVHRAVRARNALGALRLQTYECRMRESGGTFQLLSLTSLK